MSGADKQVINEVEVGVMAVLGKGGVEDFSTKVGQNKKRLFKKNEAGHIGIHDYCCYRG